MTSNSTATEDRISIEIDWADWENALPKDAGSETLVPLIEKQVQELVSEGAYPAGTSFERIVHLGGGFHFPIIEVSFPDLTALFDFYTAYCGGDSEQAIAELGSEGYVAPDNWTPKTQD